MGSLRVRGTATIATLVVLLLPSTPAVAAEAGAARLLAGSGDQYGSAGACTTWSNASGRYGIRCSGGGRATSYQDVLHGSPAPTCWLLPAGSTNPTPDTWTVLSDGSAAGRTPLAGVLEPEAAPSTEPTSEPTVDPTNAPTGEPTAQPTTTPPPESTGEPTNAAPEPTPVTPTSAPPQEFQQYCLDLTTPAGTAARPWNTELTTATVVVSVDDPGRFPFWWELTPGQRAYANRAEETRRITVGTLTTSPSTSPRIGQVVAFSAVGSGSDPVVMGDTRMRARLGSLTVDTGEPGREAVACSGSGIELAAGATERTGDGICSFSYGQTSSGRGTAAPDTYDVVATEHWRIEVSTDGGATWTLHRVVDLQARAGLRVTEVQTLVVPLS